MGSMDTFCFVLLTVRNPPMEIGKIIGDVAQWVLTNARSVFWGTLPIFYRGKKPQVSTTFSTTFGIGSLLLQN